MSKQHRVLWMVVDDNDFPQADLQNQVHSEEFEVVRVAWRQENPGQRKPYGRRVVLRQTGKRQEPVSIHVVHPSLLCRMLRDPASAIVTRELNLVTAFAVLSKLRRKRQVICLIEGDPSFGGPASSTRWKHWWRQLLHRRVDVFVSNHAAASVWLRSLGVPDDRIVEGWWMAGFDSSSNNLQPVVGDLPAADFTDGPGLRLVVVAKLIPRKGIDVLLNALATERPASTLASAQLTVVGEGPDLHQLEALVEASGLRDRVTFRGYVQHDQLAGLLLEHDALVLPSAEDLLGRVVVEALSLGLPVLVTASSGAAGTIVRDGVNGIVAASHTVAAGDAEVESLVDGLTRLADELSTLRQGAGQTSVVLTPRACAQPILTALRSDPKSL